MQRKPPFLVTSHGLCATTWLCTALNAHPDIFCSHGRSNPAEGLESEALLEDESYRKRRVEFESFQMEEMLPSDFYRLIANASGNRSYIGNVHGYILREIRERLQTDLVDFDLVVANLVRHPVEYIASYSALVQQRRMDYPEKYEQHLERARAFFPHAKKAGLSEGVYFSDPANFGFVEACWSLWGVTTDLEDRSVPHFHMEKMTTEKQYLQDMLSYLTNNNLSFRASDLKNIFTLGPSNSHQGKVKEQLRSCERDYNSWERWKQDVFDCLCGDRTRRLFADAGYEIDF